MSLIFSIGQPAEGVGFISPWLYLMSFFLPRGIWLVSACLFLILHTVGSDNLPRVFSWPECQQAKIPTLCESKAARAEIQTDLISSHGCLECGFTLRNTFGSSCTTQLG